MPTLRHSVQTALEAEPAADRDGAVAALALAYAMEIDHGGDLLKLGPALLAALEALQMSPRARAAVTRGGKSDGPGARSLDELRERRRRKSGPAAVDPAAP